MDEKGFFHPDRGYWQTSGDVPEDIIAGYPEGTLEVPLKPVGKSEWRDGAWHELPPDLDTLRQRKLANLRTGCAATIIGGFTSSALGAPHRYPSTANDQMNLMGSVTASLLAGEDASWRTPFWCADEAGEWLFREHTATEIQAVGLAGKDHILLCQHRLDILSAALNAAASVAEIDAISWED